MTETEWLARAEPEPMLEFLRGKTSDRKFQLFACACCRRVWHLLEDNRSRVAVEIAERHADRLADQDERHAAFIAACVAARQRTGIPGMTHRHVAAATAAWEAANLIDGNAGEDWTQARSRMALRIPISEKVADDNDTNMMGRVKEQESIFQSRLLFEIFGPLPFRPISTSSWRTSTVASLAHAIYDDRAFDRLPILADALEDAGCGNRDILDHCRGPGPHVRGCWVVDLVLGK